MRKRIFEIIETAKEDDRLSNVYDVFMMIVIVLSLVPLAFKTEYAAFVVFEKIAVVIFIIDYLLRIWTADLKLKKGALSFVLYPITPMALIDLLCILPSISAVAGAFRVLKVFRLLRTLRVFRVFKAVRYSKSINMIRDVFTIEKKPLITVLMLAFGYIVVSALVIFNVEPDLFDNFLDAVYWATVSLTTMGYGDITPVTSVGRAVTIISSMFGIAIIALPSGIITAGFMRLLREDQAREAALKAAEEEKNGPPLLTEAERNEILEKVSEELGRYDPE
ncbi:MAG: ion transporter [Clostridiales bacterium]|nr:ion transporter [Clostridiales bacterium]